MSSPELNRLIYFFLFISLFLFSQQQEDGMITVTFDLSDSEIEIPEDSDIVETFTAKPGSYLNIPKTELEKAGFTFKGWTLDGIRAYEPNDVYPIEDKDMILTPLFTNNKVKKFYAVDYYAELDGEVFNLTELVSPGKYKENDIVMPELLNLFCDKAKHHGWQFDGHKFLPYAKFVMPAKDVVLEPIWHRYHVMTYYAGDVEGIIGAIKAPFDLEEGGKKEMAQANRFSRKGYDIIGWSNTYDGNFYEILETYVMPDADVDLYAVWKPVEYTIVFTCGVKGVQSIKIKGYTESTITVPEMEAKNEGYTFAGWNYNGKIYLPGDEFLIQGVAPGLGISLKAVWNKNDD